MSTLIISDSRGRGLQDIMYRHATGVQTKVLIHPGAGYELAILKSIAIIRESSPGLIIVFCGICDLTWKSKVTKRVSLRYNNEADNILHVTEAIRSSFDLLRAEGSFKISYATITGVDLTDCNNPLRRLMTDIQYRTYCDNDKITHPDQRALNQSIISINKKIVIFNKRNRVKTVWTAGLVHSYIKKTYHNYYRRLFDGCHPDEKTKQAWAEQMIKSITRILATPSSLLPTPR